MSLIIIEYKVMSLVHGAFINVFRIDFAREDDFAEEYTHWIEMFLTILTFCNYK
jgi:hypothetical protein